jgi:hypothetical protein
MSEIVCQDNSIQKLSIRQIFTRMFHLTDTEPYEYFAGTN